MYVPPELLECECESCAEGDCSVDLTGISQNVHVLNLDCVKRRARRGGRVSDCAILWKNENIIAVVELKVGKTRIDADSVTAQIQGGINLIYRYLGDTQRVDDFLSNPYV